MGEIKFSVTSLTQAYRASEQLKRKGISSRILPSADQKGCKYTLAASGSLEEITAVLRQAGVRITVL